MSQRIPPIRIRGSIFTDYGADGDDPTSQTDDCVDDDDPISYTDVAGSDEDCTGTGTAGDGFILTKDTDCGWSCGAVLSKLLLPLLIRFIRQSTYSFLLLSW